MKKGALKPLCLVCYHHVCYYYTGCLNKKEIGTNMPISLKLDKHLNNLGYYMLKGYLLFSMVPRNVASIISVNEHEHFNKRLTI